MQFAGVFEALCLSSTLRLLSAPHLRLPADRRRAEGPCSFGFTADPPYPAPMHARAARPPGRVDALKDEIRTSLDNPALVVQDRADAGEEAGLRAARARFADAR